LLKTEKSDFYIYRVSPCARSQISSLGAAPECKLAVANRALCVWAQNCHTWVQIGNPKHWKKSSFYYFLL